MIVLENCASELALNSNLSSGDIVTDDWKAVCLLTMPKKVKISTYKVSFRLNPVGS